MKRTQQVAGSVAQFAIGVEALLDDSIADTDIGRIVDRGDPQPKDVSISMPLLASSAATTKHEAIIIKA